jgi:prepilin-type N-terminal cleavage/methylation domain-containing protein
MSEKGFTLVEVVIVMAISSLLFLIAFIGQRQLRARATFDGAIEKTLQNIAYTRNYALSNVNPGGQGNDTNTVTAGATFEMNNTHYPRFPLEESASVYGHGDSAGNLDLTTLSELPAGGIAACPAGEHPDDTDECREQFFGDGDQLTVSGAGFNTWFEIIYLNTGHGLIICDHSDTSGGGYVAACAAPPNRPIRFTLTDPDGLSAVIQVDPHSGYAHRLN